MGGHTSPALLETGDSVPRSSLPHRQNFHPPSLILLIFSQSQGESSLGLVFHELQISRCSHHLFIHSLLCSLAVWGKMHPRKKQRKIASSFFPQTHTVIMMTQFTQSNSHVMIQPTETPHQGSTFATENYCVRKILGEA